MGAAFETIQGTSIRSGFTDRYVSSNGVLADARACSDGTKPIQVVALYGYLSGRGASRTAGMYAGSAGVSITVAASSQAQDTGYIGTNVWNTFAGTSVNYGYNPLSGECYFGRSPGGGGSTTPYSTLAGNLGMSYEFFQCQTAPTGLVVVPADVSAMLSWGTPSDDGGSVRTGYRVQIAKNAGFTVGLSTIDVSSSATGTVVTGLTPGTLYYYRVLARNAVTDAAGKLGGVWSTTVSATQLLAPHNGTILKGGVFVEAQVERYDGSAWNPTVTANVWNGSAWVSPG